MFEQQTIEALAGLRNLAHGKDAGVYVTTAQVARLVDQLDNAGVFAALDEQTDYASAEDILAEAAAQEQLKHHRGIAPGEALQVLHNTWQRHHRHGRRDPLTPAPGQGFTQAQARALFGDGPEADAISQHGEDLTAAYSAQEPADHEHVFNSPHSDEFCVGDRDCSLTYGEYRKLH
jgi:hypothetical protein